MATIFIDGFDHYGVTGQNSPTLFSLLTQGDWTTGNAGGNPATLDTGLSSTGYALTIYASGFGNPTWIAKTLSTNYSRLIGGLRFRTNNAAFYCCPLICFLDGGTPQCAISVRNATGLIDIRNGYFSSATVLGSSSGAVSIGASHYLEWDITFGNSAAYTIYLDGVSIIAGTGDTTATANNFANGILLGNSNGSAETGSATYDDLYMFDSSGSLNNAVLNTNPRIETQYPTSDSQTQWTNAGNVLVPVGVTMTGVSNITTSTNAPGVDLALLKVTPAVNCTLQSVGLLPAATSGSAKFKAALYSDSAGAPNTLTSGSTTEVTGCTSGTALTLAFDTPQALTGGTTYWIGYITDTSVALSQYDNATNLGQKKANTYASGAPAGPLSGMTTAQPTWEMWGNATGAATNWESVATRPGPGVGPSADHSTITSSTVNNEDLYGYPALTTTPAVVHTVAMKANAKLSTSGSRTLDLRVKSSSTDSAGSTANQAIGTTYGWYSSYFERDPNGSIAWTKTSVDAATAGPKVNT